MGNSESNSFIVFTEDIKAAWHTPADKDKPIKWYAPDSSIKPRLILWDKVGTLELKLLLESLV